MFDYILILFYVLSIYWLILDKNLKFILFVLVSSSVIQVFDKPFYLQIQYFEFVGLVFLFFRFRYILKNFKAYNGYILLFLIPFFVGLIDIFVPFEFTSFSFDERFIVFIKAIGRVFGFLGGTFFLLYCQEKFNFNLVYLFHILCIAILISCLFSLIIYFEIKSPYNLLKGESYTPNFEDVIFKYRLSGFSYEPRLMGYMCVFNIFIIDSIISNKLKKFVFICFSIVCLVLTFSTSSLIFLLYLSIFFLLIRVRIKKFFTIFSIGGIFIGAIFLLFYDYLSQIIDQVLLNFEKRISFDKSFELNIFPNFFSTFELHDLPLIFYFDRNILKVIFGFGYGLGRIFIAPYSWVSDFSGESLNIIGTSTCCEPMVGFVYFLSVGGIIFLSSWFMFILFMFFKFILKSQYLFSKQERNLFYLVFACVFFILFQIPQSSVVYLLYFTLFFSRKFYLHNLTKQYEQPLFSKH